jgi:uncharacterized protein (DUF302 family)
MKPYGRRFIVHRGFEAAVGEVSRAIRDEGLEIIGRIDVRDRFRQDLRRDFRQYALLEAWTPELALEALQRNPDVGALLPTTFAVYELKADETVVMATGRRPMVGSLAASADQEITRVGRVLQRLQNGEPRRVELPAA